MEGAKDMVIFQTDTNFCLMYRFTLKKSPSYQWYKWAVLNTTYLLSLTIPTLLKHISWTLLILTIRTWSTGWCWESCKQVKKLQNKLWLVKVHFHNTFAGLTSTFDFVGRYSVEGRIKGHQEFRTMTGKTLDWIPTLLCNLVIPLGQSHSSSLTFLIGLLFGVRRKQRRGRMVMLGYHWWGEN